MRPDNHRRAAGTRPAAILLAGLALLLSGCPQNEEQRFFISAKIECDGQGRTLLAHRFEYDARWRLLKEWITDGKDQVLSVIVWNHITDDHAVKTEERPGTPGFASSSDVWFANGKITREETAIAGGRRKSTVRTEYSYNARGDLASLTRTTVDERGRLIEKYSELCDYEYTAWGRPAVKTVRMGESPTGVGSSRTTYAYNVDFLLVSEVITNDEGQPVRREYVYDDHKRVTAVLGGHPARNEYYEYYDRFQGVPAAPAPPALPVAGTVNDDDVLVLDGDHPGAAGSDRLSRGERVTVTEISGRIESREGLRAPWLKVRTARGTEGWVFGYFIDAPLFTNILAYGDDLADPDPPVTIPGELYAGKPRARLYADLVGFAPAAEAVAGERMKFLRQDNHLWQSGAGYRRFLLVSYRGRNLWISGSDLTAHYLPYQRGFFMSEERPVLRERNGRERPCLERALYYVAENGFQNFLMPLSAYAIDREEFFTITSLAGEDVNGDGTDDIIIKGVAGVNAPGREPGGDAVIERWARLRFDNTLQIMFEKAIPVDAERLPETHEYDYERDDRGFITAIVETVKGPRLTPPERRIRYVWNGSVYEKAD